MTAKEAAQKLYNILYDDRFSWTPESVDAFNIAIPVLIAQESNASKHVQGVGSVDCVERTDVINLLKRSRKDGDLVPWEGKKVLERIRNLPSVEPEIVMCKDCSNWISGYIADNDDFIPPKCGKYQQMVGHSNDDYCSLAERRTDG